MHDFSGGATAFLIAGTCKGTQGENVMQSADQEGVRIRCPYCQKVFMLRKKQPLSESGKLKMKCPHCGEEVLLPCETLAQMSKPTKKG